jgi:hypothetical protein
MMALQTGADMTLQASQTDEISDQEHQLLLGGLIAYAAHEADRSGKTDLSRRLEDVLLDIARDLPVAARKTLLLMSHEVALRDAPPERVRLYLVKS